MNIHEAVLQPIATFVYCNRQAAAGRRSRCKAEISMRHCNWTRLSSAHGRCSAKIISFHEGRAGFSLSRALFRKNVGPLPNIRIPPDWIHTTCTVTWLTVVQVSKQGCVSITSWYSGNTWLHTLWRQRATQNRFVIIISIISGMLLCCKILPVLLWGPFLWGPLFGRTCWTCLNPPLHEGTTREIK